MSTETSRRKSDSDLLNASSGDFIPIACHYNENTLITKNGELIQTIEINGINSDKISKKLFNLREMVRAAISSSVEGSSFAFWIHTIRRKANLDDDTPYNSFLSANIHDIWRRKNYWHDKFVNRLYITIIHDAPQMKLKNLNSLVNSLSTKIVTNYESNYLIQALEKLTITTDKILASLNEYGAEKLGIRFEGEDCYSEMMFLYRRIMQLNEDECPVPITDISSALASHKYAVGSDKLEVTGYGGKKFAAIMSIKEYQEVSSEALDRFLQIPVEMVCTEVFYFVDRSEVVPLFEEQEYILGISGDSELKEIKGITKIISSDQSSAKNNFCHQQISFMVMGEDLSELDKQVKHASDQLAKIGIVHVREDINLEKTFWAQLPANFSYLSRMSPTILENTAALASLHNFPTGNQYNPWGKAVTLLRTEKGTPYFMNFHDQEGGANVCIYGSRNSGKTTLLNFLLSEADKYNPSIVLITNDSTSEIFVKSKGGRCLGSDKGILNPLICDDSEESRKFIFDFLKIIANHYIKPLSEEGVMLAQTLSERVFDLPAGERKLTSLIATIKDSESGGLELLERLKVYNSGGAYHGVFESGESLDFQEGGLVSLNFEFYDDKVYTTNNYPKEKKLVEQFEYDLNTRRSLKAAAILALHYLLKQTGQGPKIFALDNMGKILNLEFFGWLVDQLSIEIQSNNGAFVSTVNIDVLQKLFEKNEESQKWIQQVRTSIFLPPEIKISSLDKILGLDSAELSKLYDLVVSSRTFLIKQDGNAIASELSIGGLPGIMRILTAGQVEKDIYQEVVKEHGDKVPEDWVEHFYNAVDNS